MKQLGLVLLLPCLALAGTVTPIRISPPTNSARQVGLDTLRDGGLSLSVSVDQGSLQVDGGTIAVTNTAVGQAVAVRCVNTSGNAFEACGGAGGSSTGVSNAELRASPINAFIDGGAVLITNFPASQAVTGPQTDAQARASPTNVFVDGGAVLITNFPASQAVTGAFYQATQPISGSVSVSSAPTTAVTGTFWQTTQPVSLASAPTTAVTNAGLSNIDVALSTRTKPADQQHTIIDSSASIAVTGPLTDTQLRLTPVPISGTVTASGPLTDTQLRATPVPISGTVTASGPVTDTQLRATPVPISGTVTATVANATLAAGSAVIGHVIVDTASTTAVTQATGTNLHAVIDTGSTTAVTQATGTNLHTVVDSITTFPDNEPFNVAQINGVAPLMGAGATGTGSLRVTIANDSTGYGTANGTIPTQSQLESSRATAYGSSPTAVAAGNNAPRIADTEGRQYVNTAHPRAITCNLTTTATSSTQVTGCELVSSNSIYITDIRVSGGIATGATAPAIIQAGTSTTCGSPVVLFRCDHPATGGCDWHGITPIKAAAGTGLCILDAVAGTKNVTITGYVAP